MGQNLSNFKDKITEQFHQVKGDANELDIMQLGYIAQPRTRFRVNIQKLAVAWLADEDKNGRYSLNELMRLIDTADHVREMLEDVVEFNPHLTFASYLRCYASLLLLKHLRTHGRQEVITWLFNLVEATCSEPPRMVNNIRYWPGEVVEVLYLLSGRDAERTPVEEFLEFQQKVLKASRDNPPLQLGQGATVADMWFAQEVLDTFFECLVEGYLHASSSLEQLSNIDLNTLAEVMADPLNPLHGEGHASGPQLSLSGGADASSAMGSFPISGNSIDMTPRTTPDVVLE